MSTTKELSPLVKIEYRATWLAQNPDATGAEVLAELAGILEALERERSGPGEDLAAGLRAIVAELRAQRERRARGERPPTLSVIRGGGEDG